MSAFKLLLAGALLTILSRMLALAQNQSAAGQ